MNKQKAIERLDAIEKEAKELRKVIEQPEVTPEQRFLEIINGCDIKIDKEKYPNSVFFFKNGEFYFQIEKSILWCRYKHVWAIFENEFSMNSQQIQAFIKGQAEEHFKMNGLTPDNLTT